MPQRVNSLMHSIGFSSLLSNCKIRYIILILLVIYESVKKPKINSQKFDIEGSYFMPHISETVWLVILKDFLSWKYLKKT